MHFQLGKRASGPQFLSVAVFKFRNLKSGQATAVPTGTFSIGRSDDAYVHLDDSSVSWRHAQLINNEKGFFLEDLGSSNGTLVHGVQLTGLTQINLGDLLQIGGIPFRIDPEVGGEPAPPVQPSTGKLERGQPRKATSRLDFVSSGHVEVPATARGNLRRHSVPLPLLARLTDSVALEKGLAPPELAPTAAPQPSIEAAPAPVFAPVPVVPSAAGESATSRVGQAPEPSRSTMWLLVLFIVGLGAGIFVGLYFARIFLEMGGKASGLP